jgi:glycosyltransferase involved in cell wall biosynthesis
MKTLVLITSQFPFGTSESFLESEFPFLNNNFDKIIIISQNVTAQKTRMVPERVTIHRYNPSTSFSEFLRLPTLIFLNFKTILNLLNEEIDFRRTPGSTILLRNLLLLLKRVIKILQLRDYIKVKLLKESISRNIVFYSYWLKTGAQAISLLEYGNSIRIARAHGSDLYEEKTVSGYLPLLNFSAKKLNAIFFTSRHGMDYFSAKVKFGSDRFIVSRLGVNRSGAEGAKAEIRDEYTIVSCSNLIPLKRIDRIIYALESVQINKEISWLHFGDGVLRNELETLASMKLGSLKRIKYQFMGHYPNNDLLDYYRHNRVDLFINTSSTEGIPVSIMEAQSFGIPVIATDTGAVTEIVVKGTGSLFPVDFKTLDLANLIEHYANIPNDEYDIIRMNAIRNWESNFNAISNYNNFISKVNSILANVIN